MRCNANLSPQFHREEPVMAEMQSPTIVNPAVIVPVNPAIESYMRSLVTHSTIRF